MTGWLDYLIRDAIEILVLTHLAAVVLGAAIVLAIYVSDRR